MNNLEFVFTGDLETLTRNQAREMIKSAGHLFKTKVTNKTNYLVAGKYSGSRLISAHSLGVKIINESEFIKITAAK